MGSAESAVRFCRTSLSRTGDCAGHHTPMKTFLLLLAASLGLAAATSVNAQAPAAATPAASASQSTPEALEEAFRKTLTDATFIGTWNGIKDGALTPEKNEKYNIVSTVKGEGDNWTINARMKYKQQELVIPIPVKVKWAGDTAVIVIDNLTIPGGGTYGARVLVHENTYAGTWSGGQRGGLLSGIIVSGQK
jgi:hypothetical protein